MMGPALSGGPGGRGVSCRVVSKGREVNACGERGSGEGLPLPRSPYPLKDRKVDKPMGPTGAPSPMVTSLSNPKSYPLFPADVAKLWTPFLLTFSSLFIPRC